MPFSISLGNYVVKKPKLFSEITSKKSSNKNKHPIFQSNKALALDNKSPTYSNAQNSIIVDADSLEIIDFVSDSIVNMNMFYEALFQLKKNKKKVRVAYFGDSMIEGDLVTQDLRSFLQNKFGGSGVGLVPITSNTAGFRQTILHEFSNNWGIYSLADKLKKNTNLGLLGYTFTPKLQDSLEDLETNYVEYKAVNRRNLNTFQNAFLFSGASEKENSVTINSKIEKLHYTDIVNIDTLIYLTKIKRLKLEFNCEAKQDFYGLSIESDSGVIVDNIAFRGNSGIPLASINSKVYQGFNQYLNYDLIILHYGLNVVTEKSEDYSWYKRGMSRTIKHIKKCFPNAAIMLISVNDKSYKVDDTFETIPGVPILVNNQKELAKENKIAFWNLYENMGGYNSMVSWVEGDTAKANKDYTHLNFRGANAVSKMFFKSLMNGYKKWLINNKKTNLPIKNT